MKLTKIVYNQIDVELVRLKKAIINTKEMWLFNELRCPNCGDFIHFYHDETKFARGVVQVQCNKQLCNCEFIIVCWHHFIPPNNYCLIKKEDLK